MLDTNVLIDAGEDDLNAQSRLIQAVIDGEITAVASVAVEREYRKIIHRLVADQRLGNLLEEFMTVIEEVKPAKMTEISLDDEEDRKILEAAVGGEADLVVTRDRHLLDVGEVRDLPAGKQIRIVTPQEAWVHFEDEEVEGGGAWREFVRGIGIGK